MSMLAERRVKKKWMLNTGRQPLWKNDESSGMKFGKELMQKMGWKAGQGLGVNEQGMTVPLKIAVKSDSKGVGFKESDNEWIQQQHEFSQFLTTLTCENKESKVERISYTTSLELKSKQSKARVHYHKFTRGKDLSRYTQKDLECILGRNDKEASEDLFNGGDGKTKCSVVEEPNLKIVNAGSMTDYFERKMKDKLKRGCRDVVEKAAPTTEMSMVKDIDNEHAVVAEVSESRESENCEKRREKLKKRKRKDEETNDHIPEEASTPSEYGPVNSSKKRTNKKSEVVDADKTFENELLEGETALSGEKIMKKRKSKGSWNESSAANDEQSILTMVEKRLRVCRETLPSAGEMEEDVEASTRNKKRRKNEAEADNSESGRKVEKLKKKKMKRKKDEGGNGQDIEETEMSCNVKFNMDTDGLESANVNEGEALADHKSPPRQDIHPKAINYKFNSSYEEKLKMGNVNGKVLNLIQVKNINIKFNGSNLALVKGYGIVRR